MDAEGASANLRSGAPAPARGPSFAEALLTEPADGCSRARRTSVALRELGFSHNNLRAGQPALERRPVHPLRYHDANFGTSDSDAEAFRGPAAAGRAKRGGPMQVSDIEADYAPAAPPDRTPLDQPRVRKGSSASRTTSGFGFVDTDNNPVIASRFVWAGDFREGRAEVETPGGMGLIDRNGKLRHPARIRNRGLHPGRKHRPGAGTAAGR